MSETIDDTMEAIERIATNQPHVFAFEIEGEVTEDDMITMARIMNAAFERYDSINMLLIFKKYNGSTFGAAFNLEAMKARFASLSNVDRYVVVGAPSLAETMIDVMGKILPIDTATYDMNELDAAWDHVGAKPLVSA